MENLQCGTALYEAALKAEKRYRALLDFLPDPVFVFNLDGTVAYINPAFEKVFGWTLEELEGRRIPFVPEDLKDETRKGFDRLFHEHVIHGFETKRLTKDGRVLDVELSCAIFFENNKPAGQIAVFRDISWEKRIAKTNRALFSIAKALHKFKKLDERLEYIAGEVRQLINVEGASVILLDEDKKEFIFRVAVFDDRETGKKMINLRFPADKGVAGFVYRTKEPLIVHDTSKSPFFLKNVDNQTGYKTKSMLDVPIHIRERMIGVLCAVNKKNGKFDRNDVEFLNAIASTVALPVENARINDELAKSYEEVRALNKAKERVIHHLSHELKTPVSVMSASLGLLSKKLKKHNDETVNRILGRAKRNLDRLLSMQYKIEDILRDKDFKSHYLISNLLDACRDELEALLEEEGCGKRAIEIIRNKTDELFGPKDKPLEVIKPDSFAKNALNKIKPFFAHRDVKIKTFFSKGAEIFIPSEIFFDIIEGLIKNAVENTPDQGLIEIKAGLFDNSPVFEVKDYGVGITKENRHLIFVHNFSTIDTNQYSSGTPYDFNAGGRGFDLLRMKIFSERYGFLINMDTKRCKFIPKDSDICPGKIDSCNHCKSVENCLLSGGTVVTVRFPKYEGR